MTRQQLPSMLSLVMAAWVALSATPSHAADWPMAGRDATRNPVSPEKNAPRWWQIPSTDPKDLQLPAKNIRWQAPLGSEVRGDPVVAGGLVWIGANNGKPRDPNDKAPAAALLCFREQDGKFLYQYVSRAAKGTDQQLLNWTGHTSSPLIDGDRMWFTTIVGEIVCLDIGPLQRGEGLPRPVWKIDMVKQLGVYPSDAPMGYGKNCSPAGYQEFLYVTTGNGAKDFEKVVAPKAPSVVCVHKATGKIIWSDNSPGKDIIDGQWASPLVVEVEGQPQVIVPQGDGWLRSFEGRTGRLLWKCDLNPPIANPRPNGPLGRNYGMAAPVYAEGRVYVATAKQPALNGPNRSCWVYCLDPKRRGDISPEVATGQPNPNSGLVWRFGGPHGRRRSFGAVLGSLAVHGGLAIVAEENGYAHALDAATGQRYWIHDFRTAIQAAPLIVDGAIYIATEDGDVVILDLAKEKRLLGKMEMPNASLTAPIFANSTLYVATRDTLYAIQGRERAHNDWPMFGRGPTRNAVSPERNPPIWWQCEERDDKNQIVIPAKNIPWTAPLGSITHGDPVVADGLIWIGTNNQRPSQTDFKNDASVFKCFRESDGKLLYEYVSPRLAAGRIHDWPMSSMACSPLIDGDRMWFTTNRCETVCLDIGPLRRGQGIPKVVWKLDMIKELGVFPHANVMSLGRHCSVARYQDFLYVITSNGVDLSRNVPAPQAPSLVCLHKDTGAVVWRDASPGKNILEGQCASPLVTVVNERALVIAPQGDGWVRTFDAVKGTLLWSFDANPKNANWKFGNGNRNSLLATPVAANGLVYIGNGRHPEHLTGEGWLYAIDPTKGGDISPEIDDGLGQGKSNPNSGLKWRIGGRTTPEDRKKLRRNFYFNRTMSNVVVHDELLVATDLNGDVYCLDAMTGKLHWNHATQTQIVTSPLIVDDKVYVATDDGTVWVFDLAKKKQVLGKIEMSTSIRSSPIFANGVLYVAGSNTLFAIAGRAKPPEQRDAAEPQTPSRRSVAGALFVPTPHDVVDKMLELASVHKDDVVYDLGCGDGRIVVAAARQYGCRAVGVDIDPQCIQRARDRMKEQNVGSLVTIEQKDLFTVDVSAASVVALYLTPRMLQRLGPQLAKLKPGTRIVAHEFPIDAVPERVVRVRSRDDGREHLLYLWTVPLKRPTTLGEDKK